MQMVPVVKDGMQESAGRSGTVALGLHLAWGGGMLGGLASGSDKITWTPEG